MFYKIILKTGSEPVCRNVRASRDTAEQIAGTLAKIYGANAWQIETLNDPKELARFMGQLAALSLLLVICVTGAIFDTDAVRPRPTRTRVRITRTREIQT